MVVIVIDSMRLEGKNPNSFTFIEVGVILNRSRTTEVIFRTCEKASR